MIALLIMAQEGDGLPPASRPLALRHSRARQEPPSRTCNHQLCRQWSRLGDTRPRPVRRLCHRCLSTIEQPPRGLPDPRSCSSQCRLRTRQNLPRGRSGTGRKSTAGRSKPVGKRAHGPRAPGPSDFVVSSLAVQVVSPGATLCARRPRLGTGRAASQTGSNCATATGVAAPGEMMSLASRVLLMRAHSIRDNRVAEAALPLADCWPANPAFTWELQRRSFAARLPPDAFVTSGDMEAASPLLI